MKSILFIGIIVILTLSKENVLSKLKVKVHQVEFEQKENTCNKGNSINNKLINGKYIPKSKPNKWEKYALGDSAHLFDYLDPVLQLRIAKYFNEIHTEASKIRGEISDIYSFDTLKQNSDKNTITNINREKWEKMISFPQVNKLNRIWKWENDRGDITFLQNSFDNFDFNGDGRLNTREFILFSIINNRQDNNLGSCLYCYNEIFESLLDPMFSFLDCNEDGLVSSEEIWNGLKKLKRSTDAYNIYKCHLSLGQTEKYPWTIAVNDFVLLNTNDYDTGKINLKQFRIGILVGYWQRQISDEKIYWENNELDMVNNKKSRWGDYGTKDLGCQEFLSLAD